MKIPASTSGPRQANVRRLQAKALATASSPSSGDDVPLANPGDMQIYSFYKPSLVAGTYTITTTQVVSYQDNDSHQVQQTLDAPVGQPVDVVAPQFTIDPKDIHSTYPPPGHADQPMILPHIVLSDAHLPWERLSSVTYQHNVSDPSILPWLAVLPFDPDGLKDLSGSQELRLSDAQLNGDKAVYKSLNSTDPLQQSPAFTLTMTVAEFLKLPQTIPPGGTPVHVPNYAIQDARNTDFGNIKDLDTAVQVIFISGTLFRSLFVSKSDPTKIDLDHYKYCAHVRNINTENMKQAGVEDQGVFSIIHSRRSGPTDIVQNTAPRPQVVHLISLEFIADMDNLPNDTDLVALISLYSWSYLCQPPLSVNFVDSMRNIGLQVKDPKQSNLLRYGDSFMAAATQKPQLQGRMDLQQTISQRMRDGYTFTRQRVGTGEQTVAYFRGALTPNPASTDSFLNWPVSSNNGQDYLILDPKQGVMDITYSSAWQLGKTMAISDFGFASALMRFRMLLHTQGVKAAAFTRVAMAVNVTTEAETLTSLGTRLAAVVKASTLAPPLSQVRSAPAHAPVSLPDRFAGPESDVHPEIKQAFVDGIASAAKVLTAAFDDPVNRAFDEVTTKPANSDWKTILTWILDRMWLSSIPSQYLVSDASFLPPESIRFFHIDQVWINCFVDGALSVANHLARETDPVRQEIKRRVSEYLGGVLGTGDQSHHPQVPTFGFLLRSAAVAAFPEMRIEVPYTTDKAKNSTVQGGKLPILVRKQFAADITMCLLDRIPVDGQIASIKISQPVHQQCFSVGDFLDGSTVEFMFRKIYRSMSDPDAKSQFFHEMGNPQTWKQGASPSIYDWSSRCVQMDVLNQALFGKDSPNGLPQQLPDEWGLAKGGFILDSSMAGLQLSDPVVYLEMVRPDDIPETIAPPVHGTQIDPGSTGTGTVPMQPASKLWLGADTQEQVAAVIRSRNDPMKLLAVSNSSPAVSPTPQRLLVVQNKTEVGATVPTQALPSAPNIKPVVSPPDWLRYLTNAPTPSTHSPVPPQPQFICSIFPSTVRYARNQPSFVFVDTPYDCDLVFSVILPDKLAQEDLFLSMLVFKIPIGAESERVVATGLAQNLKPGPGLIPDHTYTSLSARMLSNQRWVVHIDPVPPYLIVRLLPRTTHRTMPILQNKSLSFQLNGVPLAGVDGDNLVTGNVFIGVQEYYVAPGPSKTVKDGTLQGKPTSAIILARTLGWVG